MKKAVIKCGSKQFLVSAGDQIEVDLISGDSKSITFDPLLVFDDKEVKVGTPSVGGAKVTAQIVSADKQADKVVSIRYKAKKRIRKVRGHRQRHATIKIDKIT